MTTIKENAEINAGLEQKLVSFTENPIDLNRINDEMKNGWYFVNLTKNGGIYVGIMENREKSSLPEDSIFIPARKRIKITSSAA